MRTSTLLLTGLALTLTIAVGASPARAQIRFESPEHEKKVRHLVPVDHYPVADFNASEPPDLKERALRLARSKRHNNTNLSQSDVPRFVFQEGTGPINLGLPWSHAPIESAFPVGQSDAVVIGEVKDAHAYLSQDKTSVYSEFTLRIEEVLKSASSSAITPDSTIAAERGGGRVRLASGKEILRGFIGKPMPCVGRRYVFFLKGHEEAQSFSIITGYELRSGQVSPLDGSSRFRDEMVIPEFAEYDRYDGVNESDFLRDVNAALNVTPQSNNGSTRRPASCSLMHVESGAGDAWRYIVSNVKTYGKGFRQN